MSKCVDSTECRKSWTQAVGDLKIVPGLLWGTMWPEVQHANNLALPLKFNVSHKKHCRWAKSLAKITGKLVG